jgi:hypothetical protein
MGSEVLVMIMGAFNRYLLTLSRHCWGAEKEAAVLSESSRAGMHADREHSDVLATCRGQAAGLEGRGWQ